MCAAAEKVTRAQKWGRAGFRPEEPWTEIIVPTTLIALTQNCLIRLCCFIPSLRVLVHVEANANLDLWATERNNHSNLGRYHLLEYTKQSINKHGHIQTVIVLNCFSEFGPVFQTPCENLPNSQPNRTMVKVHLPQWKRSWFHIVVPMSFLDMK